MIRRAIQNGVSEDRLARTLHVDVASICKKRDLFDGICPEAIELLMERHATAGAIRELRRVKPMRQLEMVELMIASGNFSANYAKCLLAATPQEQLIESERSKEVAGLTADDVARIEGEMESLEQDFRTIEDTHGKTVLNLVIVVGYLKKLLDSARVVRYLSTNHPEILAEFQKLVETRAIADAVSVSQRTMKITIKGWPRTRVVTDPQPWRLTPSLLFSSVLRWIGEAKANENGGSREARAQLGVWYG